MPSPSTPVERTRRSTRPSPRITEIDGLRGIALTLVVVFHLFGHGRVSGGVDVFLTISGFLLVLSLGRALRDGRELGIRRRWARTFARLAPPAALVLIVVTIMSYTVLSPWSRQQTLHEVVAAALYMENWQLIWSQLSYEAAGPLTSPVQHFWSLSVQAQFFLVFPVLVALLALVVRGRRVRQLVFWWMLSIGTAASFGYAWYANAVDPQAAYFDTFARFWELGIGGLAAGVYLLGYTFPAALRAAGGWIGLAAIVGSGFVFDGGTAYPGPAALLPVGGALLVLFSTGGGRASTTPLLSSRPLVFLDRISYGLYVWHWPVLIGYLTVRQQDVVGPLGAAGVLAVSIAATLLTRIILRKPSEWGMSARRYVAASVAIVSIVAAAAPAAALAVAEARGTGTAIEVADCAGAASLDPDRPECADFDGDGQIVPGLDDIRQDDANRAGCWARTENTEFELCPLGDEDAGTQILAVGDSHNNVYIDVYEQIAEARGWRVDVAGRAGCQWVASDSPVYGQNDASQAACAEWRETVDDLAASGEYDAIVTVFSSISTFRSENPDQTDEQYHAQQMTRAWASRTDTSTPIIALRDNPIFPAEMMDCLVHDEAVAAGDCSLPREEALLPTGVDIAVDETENAHLIDLTEFMCGPERCDMVVGGVYVSRDGGHLTRTYAATLAPYLDRELGRIVG